jgi:hypothetical protein
MSAYINNTITKLIQSSAYGSLSNGIAVVAVVLLLFLLTEKVLLEAYQGKTNTRKTQGFNLAIWPLLFSLVIFTVMRFMQIYL